MKLLYGKAMWGQDGLSLKAFLAWTKDHSFDVTEINLSDLNGDPAESVALHQQYGLGHISQLVPPCDSVDDHLRFLDKWFPIAVDFKPLHINIHTGCDFFTFEENLMLFKKVAELSNRYNIPVTHETHRGRALYSAVQARKYLEACPDIFLNADFSHWMVVHESDLSNQPDTMELAIRHSRYIHARVGYEEGPQVPHPLAPEWQGHLKQHLNLWQRIVDACRRAGQPHLVITPEFGPPPYLHTAPFTNQPVANLNEVNAAMLKILKERLK